MTQQQILYHWSPRNRLRSIQKYGLLPGKRNVQGPTYHDPDNPKLGEFRMPSVCFSLDPATAWAYSHAVFETRGVFDLWQVLLLPSDFYEMRKEDGRVVEVRIHHRVPKKRVVWVAERTYPKAQPYSKE